MGAMKAFAAEFRRAFPDVRDPMDDQVAEGDKVVTGVTLLALSAPRGG